MKAGKILELYRLETDDTVQPYLISDTEALAFLNEAEVEACRRARLLVDSTTAAICQITATVNTQDFTLDPRVISVRRAKLASDSYPLVKKQLDALDEECPGWDSDGIPAGFYTRGLGNRTISIPKQDVETTLNMVVTREPLAEINDPEESPEIPARYHHGLLNYMKFKHYMKLDTEAHDPKKAASFLALFEQEFGPKRTAIDEQFEEEHEGYDQSHGSF